MDQFSGGKACERTGGEAGEVGDLADQVTQKGNLHSIGVLGGKGGGGPSIMRWKGIVSQRKRGRTRKMK